MRLLVACALADILRIFAPEPPYEEETNADVIKLFIKILRGFQSPEMTPQHPSYRFVRGSVTCLTSLLPLLMTSFVRCRFPLVVSAVGLQPTLISSLSHTLSRPHPLASYLLFSDSFSLPPYLCLS